MTGSTPGTSASQFLTAAAPASCKQHMQDTKCGTVLSL